MAILRRRVLVAIGFGLVELKPGMEGATIQALTAHSFRVGLTQDLFAAQEDGSGIALALRRSSPTSALRYARELAVGSNATARVLGNCEEWAALTYRLLPRENHQLCHICTRSEDLFARFVVFSNGIEHHIDVLRSSHKSYGSGGGMGDVVGTCAPLSAATLEEI